jgi:hypothetical protein
VSDFELRGAVARLNVPDAALPGRAVRYPVPDSVVTQNTNLPVSPNECVSKEPDERTSRGRIASAARTPSAASDKEKILLSEFSA